MQGNSDSKKFFPNLANCRSRKNSDTQLRVDSENLSSFALKNQGFYFPPRKQSHSGEAFEICEETWCSGEECTLQNGLLPEAQEFAAKQGGTCLSASCEHPFQGLFFKCRVGHIFETSLASEDWCHTCKRILEKAQSFARDKGGECLDQVCDVVLEFKCEFGHTWKADALKYRQQKWCKQCGIEARMRRKQDIKNQQKAAEEAQAKLQEELFEEAKRKMMAEASVSNGAVLACEPQIDYNAQEMTRRFMESPSFQGECSFEQAFGVYKVLCSTEEFLVARYFQKASNWNYKQLAKSIHPDKNSHPLSGQAFQRLSNAYSSAVTKLI